MSTAATRTRKQLPRLGLSAEKGNEILGVVLFAVVALLLASLLSYHPLDPSLFHRVADENARPSNFIGPFGAQLAALCFAFLGLTSFLLPVLLGIAAWRRVTGRDSDRPLAYALGIAALLPTLPSLFQLLLGQVPWRGVAIDSGGAVGVVVADLLVTRLNSGGAFVVLFAVLLVGGNLAVRSTFGELAQASRERLAALWERFELFRVQRRKRRQEASTRRRVIRRHLAGSAADAAPSRGAGEGASPAPAPPAGAAEREAAKLDLPMRVADMRVTDVRVTEKKGEGHFAVRKVQPHPEEPPAPPVPQQKDLAFDPDEVKPQELPPVNLLNTESPKRAHDEKELVHLGEVIREALEHFGIEGSIEGISPGPVITIFEFQPAPGIKVSRIVNLQDDLALALKAESVRIDRMAGRSTLGIEVPNKVRSVIRLGQLMADDKFKRSPSVLTVALGVDIYGRPFYADLATMPHLLVAGATGAGKSVGLQSMITSILYKATRDQVQFIFVDPKRIELGVYADIPHLKTEVVMEPKKAANALRWAVSEMERRYRLLAEVHVRSIDYYNRAIRDPKERQRLSLKEGESELTADDLKPLPYYVIIIDELADLMMVAASEVEASIARLAQMARAVGIHLIVATQRPSVDILTGTIKANFPCRLSYATATRHDSRTILDQVGAEKLLGKGDALFIPPGTSRIRRLHGAYVTEQETAALIRWLKRRGKPDLDLDILKSPETDGGGGGAGGGDDDLFEEAARLVVGERQASASFLQRRLRIGFSRAARLIDMMEADGLLGPAQGSKPRDVLVPQNYFEEIDRALAEE
jgi:S-DNA-T family DNA segregation ATPase FtsK/SpoIIIE